MNIKEAKEQIKNAISAYFTKDEFGEYLISPEKQRPVFLIGAPGIGKTAVMEQISQELGIGLVSYSMTHHTRQSALGLPYIQKKQYGGKEYSVSEYTMSEIIASVYDKIQESGLEDGIIFLDEINCVSETLAPAMLQFLQYKIFGRHRVPPGWIVVTAGNPPEYNKSVREYDIVTWDRLKRIDVEPDFDIWKEYAYKKGVHGAIMTYLEIKKTDFYTVETTVDGPSFVTARGWDDLSEMIGLYEKKEIPVNGALISQYIQNTKIAKDFSIYYDLYNKYKSDYQVDKILAGDVAENIVERASAARFDERLSLLGLLLDAVNTDIRSVIAHEDVTAELLIIIKGIRDSLSENRQTCLSILDEKIDRLEGEFEYQSRAGILSKEAKTVKRTVINILRDMRRKLEEANIADNEKAFTQLKKDYNQIVAALRQEAAAAGKKLSHLFHFAESAFQAGHELLILVTELTVNYYSAKFIGKYGCEEYFRYNKELLFYERQQDIMMELECLNLELE
ncbi:MAG TPA: MoxR family ATPase [Syntrophomonas sp.]|nr:MoxR family ATPase [Syntrophomonas sp.]